MDGKGMVAVVRNLHSGLAVTVVDGFGEYTLVPNNEVPSSCCRGRVPASQQMQQHCVAVGTDNFFVAAVGTQSEDSPFDNQKTEVPHAKWVPAEVSSVASAVSPDPDNFTTVSFQDNLVPRPTVTIDRNKEHAIWSDKGSHASRSSRDQSPAFSRSLRKCPKNVSIESSEVLERLITYTNPKVIQKPVRRSCCRSVDSRPWRTGVDEQLRKARPSSRGYISNPEYRTADESPTRDVPPDQHDKTATPGGINDQPCVPAASHQFDQHRNFDYSGESTASTVNHTEVQVAAKMVSKQVATDSLKKNVFINTLSPATSTSSRMTDRRKTKSHTSESTHTQTVPCVIRKSVQTNSSSFTLLQSLNCNALRVSKSHEDFANMRNEIYECMDAVSACDTTDSNVKCCRRQLLNKLSEKIQEYTNTCDTVDCKTDRCKETEVGGNKDGILLRDDRNIKNIILKWLSKAPVRICGCYSCNDLNYFIHKLSENLEPYLNGDKGYEIDKARALVTKFLEEISSDVDYNTKKKKYICKLAQDLINNIQSNCDDGNARLEFGDNIKIQYNNNKKALCELCGYIKPTAQDLKEFVLAIISDFAEKHNKNLSKEYLDDVQLEIVEIVLDSIETLRLNEDKEIKDEISTLLVDSKVFSQREATRVTSLMINKLKGLIGHSEAINTRRCHSETLLVLQNSYRNRKDSKNKTDTDVNFDLDRYVRKISKQIELWLNSLQTTVPKTDNKGLRQVVINDLAMDIVDRHKYQELSGSGSDEDELEHLKFQIFKWINKLVGEDNLETIERAPDLMGRIRSVYYPTKYQDDKMSLYQRNVPTQSFIMLLNKAKTPSGTTVNKGHDSIGNSSVVAVYTDKVKEIHNNGEEVSKNSENHNTTVKKVNENFNGFLSEWVKQLPLPTATTEEKEREESCRKTLQNEILKIITKLKLRPELVHNPTDFNAWFVEELDKILNQIPLNSNDANIQSHIAYLLQNTCVYTKQIVEASVTFKTKLLENVANSIPRGGVIVGNEETSQLYNEIEILSLIDEYILSVRYQSEDPQRAEVHRKILAKKAEDYIENIKQSQGDTLKHINTEVYRNDVLNALYRVPLPNEECIKQEANEISLGVEIDQWIVGLPVEQNVELIESLRRRKLRNAFAKKIADIEKESNLMDPKADQILKYEITKFLEKMPLLSTENIGFKIEELANRVKNLMNDGSMQEKRKVSFQDGANLNHDFTESQAGASYQFTSALGQPTPQSYQQALMNKTQNDMTQGLIDFGAPIGCSSFKHMTYTLPDGSVIEQSIRGPAVSHFEAYVPGVPQNDLYIGGNVFVPNEMAFDQTQGTYSSVPPPNQDGYQVPIQYQSMDSSQSNNQRGPANYNNYTPVQTPQAQPIQNSGWSSLSQASRSPPGTAVPAAGYQSATTGPDSMSVFNESLPQRQQAVPTTGPAAYNATQGFYSMSGDGTFPSQVQQNAASFMPPNLADSSTQSSIRKDNSPHRGSFFQPIVQSTVRPSRPPPGLGQTIHQSGISGIYPDSGNFPGQLSSLNQSQFQPVITSTPRQLIPGQIQSMHKGFQQTNQSVQPGPGQMQPFYQSVQSQGPREVQSLQQVQQSRPHNQSGIQYQSMAPGLQGSILQDDNTSKFLTMDSNTQQSRPGPIPVNFNASQAPGQRIQPSQMSSAWSSMNQTQGGFPSQLQPQQISALQQSPQVLGQNNFINHTIPNVSESQKRNAPFQSLNQSSRSPVEVGSLPPNIQYGQMIGAMQSNQQGTRSMVGLLGTSQIPGPSNQTQFLSPHQMPPKGLSEIPVSRISSSGVQRPSMSQQSGGTGFSRPESAQKTTVPLGSTGLSSINTPIGFSTPQNGLGSRTPEKRRSKQMKAEAAQRQQEFDGNVVDEGIDCRCEAWSSPFWPYTDRDDRYCYPLPFPCPAYSIFPYPY